ncbi:hypothetical protein IV203_004120 [Nitzschia inconspicua]|uniref:Uncharacterized protein n=1 Tax=Nitzschia inconspicua TaxID=303405 RepID=A0A9K3PRM2_9STRA|nr:hypothetical protein IV203_004120 [Nitzschia inconspicua]
MEDNNTSAGAASSSSAPEGEGEIIVGRNFSEQPADGKDDVISVTTADPGDNSASDNISEELDQSNYTPKTSNKRVVSIQQTEGENVSLFAIHEQQAISLPFQNPLHYIDCEYNDEGGDAVGYKSHFAVDQGVDHDLRPVAPTRKASDGSFQGTSAKVMALELKKCFDDDEDDDKKDRSMGEEADEESVASSYVGDVDERSVQKKEIQFQPEGYLSVEPMITPKEGSFNTSVVPTGGTSTVCPSGTTDNVVPLSPGCTSSGTREINFSPGASDIEGSEAPKQGSFRGNGADFMGEDDESPRLTLLADVKTAVTGEAAFADTTLLGMEEMLGTVLNSEIVSNHSSNSTSCAENLSESNIPSESFLKMGEVMQSQLQQSEELDEGVTGDQSKDTERNDVLNDTTDEGLIVAGESDVEHTHINVYIKDDHDDLLDSMLGDNELEDSYRAFEPNNEPLANDIEDDNILETMLEQTASYDEKHDEYVPDESIRKLEALLDEGLTNLESMAVEESRKVMEESEKLEIDASDSIARELDALLDGDLEEELNFEVEETLPARRETFKAIVGAAREVKSPIAQKKSGSSGTYNVSRKVEGHQKKSRVARLFDKRELSKKFNKTTPEKASNERTPIFGSSVARRASDSVRKRFSSGQKKAVSSKPGRSREAPPNVPAKKPETKIPKTSFIFSTPKRFMSPTIAFKRHIGLATEDCDAKFDKSFVSPLQTSSEPPKRSSRKNFMSSTFSSLKKFRSNSAYTEGKKHRSERCSGNRMNPDGTKSRVVGSYMENTFAKTMLETETRIVEERKALEKEEEIKKIVVHLQPWKEDRKRSPFLDYSYKAPNSDRSPREFLTPNHQMIEKETILSSSCKRRVLWTPNTNFEQRNSKDSAVVLSTPGVLSPHGVFSPRSYGSLSSQCSIRSFVSPDKAGIIGCQSKYNPYLHKTKGPCELCVFQLSEEGKDELDANGRHLMVQFTSGGCPECLEFPTSFDEGPVRLCPRCYSISHRPKKNYRRKKGNDAARMGYTFAKKEYA